MGGVRVERERKKQVATRKLRLQQRSKGRNQDDITKGLSRKLAYRKKRRAIKGKA